MNTQMADAFMAIFGYRRVENDDEKRSSKDGQTGSGEQDAAGEAGRVDQDFQR